MKTQNFSFSLHSSSPRAITSAPCSPRASYSPRKTYSFKKKGIHEKERTQYKNFIQEGNKIRAYLEEQINCLENADFNNELKEKMFSDFKNLNENFMNQLNERKKKLDDLAKQNMIFQRIDKEKNFQPVESYPILQHRLPSPNRPPRKQISSPRTRYLQDLKNEDLLNTIKFNERQIIIAKQRIKLWHDYRELKMLNDAIEDFDNFKEQPKINETDTEKESLQYLKDRINRERSRIDGLSESESVENSAARSIQSAWRGYLVRKGNKTQQPKEPETQNQLSSPRSKARPVL